MSVPVMCAVLPSCRARSVVVVVDAPATAEPGPVLSGTGPDPDRMPLGRAHRASEITRHVDGEMVGSAYTPRPDGDRGQAGTLVREVWDDAAHDRPAPIVVGHLLSEPVPAGAFESWRNVDKTLGDQVGPGVHSNGVGTGRPAAQFFRGSSSGRPGSRGAPTAGPDSGHETVVGG